MIDLTKAQAQQLTHNGVNGEWVFTLDDEELGRLPPTFTVQDVFLVRDFAQAMVARAIAETKEQEQSLCLVKINRIVEHGDAKLDQLRAENERLAEILETHIGEPS